MPFIIDVQTKEAKRLQTVTKHICTDISILIKMRFGYYGNSVNVQQQQIESRARVRAMPSFLNFEPKTPYQTFFILIFYFSRYHVPKHSE